ncbi:cyclin-like protein [Patellaria atrata CBS 101060]|uniref:Cyclin-like protein n=1 Tax=Patellaria atrata CBS 101060 TaxID=1346257 RepID=A0A9P4VQ32_9PEZI|nr:cyclin-like protein [Patellaria atrata CBS 101060]
MTEDEIFKISTQYRLWTFTPKALESLRGNTNSTAAERVRAAFNRIHEDGDPQSIECLTVAEEQKLVLHFCIQCLESNKQVMKLPFNVVATAVQYIKRFYLYNSPMTYSPSKIWKAAFYLATKTEGAHSTVEAFAKGFDRTVPEDILAPEFILTQSLRYAFDIRHPFRGLRGGHIELIALATGKAAVLPGINRSPSDLQQEMLQLPAPGSQSSTTKETAAMMLKRIHRVYGRADGILRSTAILSDAYFLYTPSQIWLSAFLLVDEPLTQWYISTKFPSDLGESDRVAVTKDKVLATLKSCAALLEAGNEILNEDKAELSRIARKLKACQNPDKVDLVGLNKAQKRDTTVDGKLDESVAKRRKLEREKVMKEGDDLFGPGLVKE